MFIRNEKRFNIYAPQEIDGVMYPRFTDPALRESLGIIEIPDPSPPLDYSEDAYYRTEQDMPPYVVYTKKSDEQIAEVNLQKAKHQRQADVDSIVVTTSTGKQFDGNEDAQNRMSRGISVMSDTDTMIWVLADNTLAQVNKAELVEALKLAGQEMAQIWVRPYQV